MAHRTQIGPKIYNTLCHLSQKQDATADCIWFARTATLTSAAAATAVSLVADSELPNTDYACHVDYIYVQVNGATAWTDATATKVSLTDTNSSAVTFADFAKAGLTANAAVFHSAASNVTLGAGFKLNAGGTAGKGLQVVADAVFAAGSDIVITVKGYIAKQANV